MATESKVGGLQAVIAESDQRRENGNGGKKRRPGDLTSPDPATAWRRSGTDKGGGPSLLFFGLPKEK